jgi:hypothetical protein
MDRFESSGSDAEEPAPDLLSELSEDPPAWTPAGREAADRAIQNGVPSEGLALFARWWQLEAWLRLLVYLELRAAKGGEWSRVLGGRGQSRADQDLENRYMPSADATNPISYLAAGELFSTIRSEGVWPLVKYALPKLERWNGTVDQLLSVRNRIAHLRRPHPDDLGRVEQALRDLEPGARKALEAFNRQHSVGQEWDDPLANAWVRGEHPDARRLLEHAFRNYDTEFKLAYSIRPWTAHPSRDTLVGTPGVLIHATWFIRGEAMLEPRAFWEDDRLDFRGARELIVFATHQYESMVSIAFSAVDDPSAVADAIGACFDTVLSQRDRHPSNVKRRRWRTRAQGLDWRVHVDSALVLATEDRPFSIFRA